MLLCPPPPLLPLYYLEVLMESVTFASVQSFQLCLSFYTLPNISFSDTFVRDEMNSIKPIKDMESESEIINWIFDQSAKREVKTYL